MDYYYYTVFIVEFLAAISATVFLYKYRYTPLFWLLPLLWFIPINELVCQYVFPREPVGYMLYNIYRLIVPITIITLVLSELKKSPNRFFVKILIGLAVLLYIVEIFLINPFNSFFDFSFTTSSIFIVISLLVYFVEELNGNHHSQVKRNLFLWVCFGFLIFHLTYPIIFFAQKYIDVKNEAFILTLNKVQLILAILSYITIAFGFYWGDKLDVTQKKEHHHK